ncbi:MAG: NUDIX domain-containing protein [Lachnospiraceae bacterium]|nr:NUDIX domain-containing protein [Lachnospiraceae bacterium]
MEKVLVVPTTNLEPYLKQDGLICDNISTVLQVIINNNLYIDRDYAEYAEEYKQIIPYVVLLNDDKVFITQRLKAQTEKRLHGKCSIGLGGHINPSVEKSSDVIYEGMKRELYEEVGLTDIHKHECIGIINDLSTEVSNFHIALVYFSHVSPDVQIRETEKMTGHWASDDEVLNVFDYLESWSQIIWENKDKWKK